jgi:hypothetical protein
VARVRCQFCGGKGETLERDWQSGYEDYYPCRSCGGTGYVEDSSVSSPHDHIEGLAKRLYMEDHKDTVGQLYLVGGWHQDGVAEKYRSRARRIIGYLAGKPEEPF